MLKESREIVSDRDVCFQALHAVRAGLIVFEECKTIIRYSYALTDSSPFPGHYRCTMWEHLPMSYGRCLPRFPFIAIALLILSSLGPVLCAPFCPPGSQPSVSDARTCILCPMEHFSADGSACLPCAPGSHALHVGSLMCERCNPTNLPDDHLPFRDLVQSPPQERPSDPAAPCVGRTDRFTFEGDVLIVPGTNMDSICRILVRNPSEVDIPILAVDHATGGWISFRWPTTRFGFVSVELGAAEPHSSFIVDMIVPSPHQIHGTVSPTVFSTIGPGAVILLGSNFHLSASSSQGAEEISCRFSSLLWLDRALVANSEGEHQDFRQDWMETSSDFKDWHLVTRGIAVSSSVSVCLTPSFLGLSAFRGGLYSERLPSVLSLFRSGSDVRRISAKENAYTIVDFVTPSVFLSALGRNERNVNGAESLWVKLFASCVVDTHLMHDVYVRIGRTTVSCQCAAEKTCPAPVRCALPRPAMDFLTAKTVFVTSNLYGWSTVQSVPGQSAVDFSQAPELLSIYNNATMDQPLFGTDVKFGDGVVAPTELLPPTDVQRFMEEWLIRTTSVTSFSTATAGLFYSGSSIVLSPQMDYKPKNLWCQFIVEGRTRVVALATVDKMATGAISARCDVPLLPSYASATVNSIFVTVSETMFSPTQSTTVTGRMWNFGVNISMQGTGSAVVAQGSVLLFTTPFKLRDDVLSELHCVFSAKGVATAGTAFAVGSDNGNTFQCMCPGETVGFAAVRVQMQAGEFAVDLAVLRNSVHFTDDMIIDQVRPRGLISAVSSIIVLSVQHVPAVEIVCQFGELHVSFQRLSSRIGRCLSGPLSLITKTEVPMLLWYKGSHRLVDTTGDHFRSTTVSVGHIAQVRNVQPRAVFVSGGVHMTVNVLSSVPVSEISLRISKLFLTCGNSSTPSANGRCSVVMPCIVAGIHQMDVCDAMGQCVGDGTVWVAAFINPNVTAVLPSAKVFSGDRITVAGSDFATMVDGDVGLQRTTTGRSVFEDAVTANSFRVDKLVKAHIGRRMLIPVSDADSQISRVIFSLPRGIPLGFRPLEVLFSSDGSASSDREFAMHLLPIPRVLSWFPKALLAERSVLITISGVDFPLTSLACTTDSYVGQFAEAFAVSSHIVRCDLTGAMVQQQQSAVALLVSVDRKIPSESNIMHILPHTVGTVLPVTRNGSLHTGGGELSLTFDNFHQADRCAMRWYALFSKKTIISGDCNRHNKQLRFAAPASRDESSIRASVIHDVPVCLLLDNPSVGLCDTNSLTNFFYRVPNNVSAILDTITWMPILHAQAGLTVSIMIELQHFIPYAVPEYFCEFSTAVQHSARAEATVLRFAYVEGTRFLQCGMHFLSAGFWPVQILSEADSFDQMRLSWTVQQLEVREKVIISDILPKYPPTSGSKDAAYCVAVTVIGRNFEQSNAAQIGLRARWDFAPTGSWKFSAIVSISSGMVLGSFPPVATDLLHADPEVILTPVAFRLSSNQVDFDSFSFALFLKRQPLYSHKTILYHCPHQGSRTQPVMGFPQPQWRAGGIAPSCGFGKTKVQILDNTALGAEASVRCFPPSQPINTQHQLSVSLSDFQNYEPSDIWIQYFERISNVTFEVTLAGTIADFALLFSFASPVTSNSRPVSVFLKLDTAEYLSAYGMIEGVTHTHVHQRLFRSGFGSYPCRYASFQLSETGSDWVTANQQFEFLPTPIVASVYPSEFTSSRTMEGVRDLAQRFGGSLLLTLTGDSFLDRHESLCQFQDHLATKLSRISTRLGVCTLPVANRVLTCADCNIGVGVTFVHNNPSVSRQHGGATLRILTSVEAVEKVSPPDLLLLHARGGDVVRFPVSAVYAHNDNLYCLFGRGTFVKVNSESHERPLVGSTVVRQCAVPQLPITGKATNPKVSLRITRHLHMQPFLSTFELDSSDFWNVSVPAPSVIAVQHAGLSLLLSFTGFASPTMLEGLFNVHDFVCHVADTELVPAYWSHPNSAVNCEFHNRFVFATHVAVSISLKGSPDTQYFPGALVSTKTVEQTVIMVADPVQVFVSSRAQQIVLVGLLLTQMDICLLNRDFGANEPGSFNRDFNLQYRAHSSRLAVCVIREDLGINAGNYRLRTASVAFALAADVSPRIRFDEELRNVILSNRASLSTGGSRLELSYTVPSSGAGDGGHRFPSSEGESLMGLIVKKTLVRIDDVTRTNPSFAMPALCPDQAALNPAPVSLQFSSRSAPVVLDQASIMILPSVNVSRLSTVRYPLYIPHRGGGLVYFQLSSTSHLQEVSNFVQCNYGGFSSSPVAHTSHPNVIGCEAPSGISAFRPMALSQPDHPEFTNEGHNVFIYTSFEVAAVLPGVVSSVQPTILTVLGSHFLNVNSDLQCAVGQGRFASVTLSSRLSRCLMEPLAVGNFTGNNMLFVEMSLGGRDLTHNSTELHFSSEIARPSVFPSSTLTIGGTIFSISTSVSALSATNHLSCLFDKRVLVRARYLNRQQLECVAPVLKGSGNSSGRYISLSVTQTPQHLSDTAPVFTNATSLTVRPSYLGTKIRVRSPTELTSLLPTFGPVYGGTIVFVSGSGFRDLHTVAYCRFGRFRSHKPAKILSDSLLSCVSPPVFSVEEYQLKTAELVRSEADPYRSTMPRKVSVLLVSNENVPVYNGTAAPREINFEYTPCPPGFYCSGEVMIPAPVGTYTPLHHSTNYTQCPQGMYQDSFAQPECLPCPLGSVCPYTGMRGWQACPSGRVCNATGLVVSRGLCPPGYYCADGTKTYDPQSTIPERPRICPQGVFCREGTRQLSPSLLEDFGTSQPCFAGYVCLEGASDPRGTYPCPPGYYCTPEMQNGGLLATVPKPCVPGTYCNGTANVKPRLCHPGTYADAYGGTLCKPCPFGFLCQGFGVVKPDLCAPGYVCTERGLAVPRELCPAGHYCRRGIATALPLANPLFDDGIRRPVPCPAGTFCLPGVRSLEVRKGMIGFPQPCLAGTYCPVGTKSQVAVECPPGTYCQSGSSAPTPTQAGYVAPDARSVRPTPCVPGTYAPSPSMTQCLQCPPGFTCSLPATVTPASCPPGTFRNQTDGISCLACPQGTWSETESLTDRLLCKECPMGLVCPAPGLPSLSDALSCPEGFFCGERTTLAEQRNSPCPSNVTCTIVTYFEISRLLPCPPGFGCHSATPFTGRRRSPCAPGYYCPPVQSSVSQLRYKCPLGTTSRMGAKVEYDCEKDVDYLESHGGYVLSLSPLKVTESLRAQLAKYKAKIIEKPYSTAAMGTLAAGRPTAELIFQLPPMAYLTFSFFLTNHSDLLYNDDFRISLYEGDSEENVLPMDSDGDGVIDKFPERLEDPEYLLALNSQVDKRSPFDMYYFAKKRTFLRMTIEIVYGVLAPMQHRFLEVVTAKIITPGRASSGSTASPSFFALFPRNDDLSLPLNPPAPDEDLGSYGFIPKTPSTQMTRILTEDELRVEPDEFWLERGALVMPYLPFASKCEGFDRFVPLSAIFESEDYCTLVETGATIFVNEFNPFGSPPVADSCSAQLNCYFEENVEGTAQAPRWYEAEPEKDPVFYITTDPVPAEKGANGGSDFESLLLTDAFLPVLVNSPPGMAGTPPSSVTFQVGYYQFDQTDRRIVAAEYVYDYGGAEELYTFGAPSDSSTNTSDSGDSGFGNTQPKLKYAFNVEFVALPYFDLLNLFSFSLTVYLILYFVIAIVAVSISLAFWLVHRIFTKLKHPPGLRFFAALKMMALPPVFGAWIVIIPSFALIVLFWLIIGAGVLDFLPGNYNAPGQLSTEDIEGYRAGRFGVVNLITGVFLSLQAVQLLVLDRGDNTHRLLKADDEELWFPMSWKRSHLLFVGFINVIFLILMLEFSYTTYFATNVYLVVVALKIVGMIYNKFLGDAVFEALYVVPYGVAFLLTQFTMTMGASTFVDFVIGFFIDLILAILQRLYFDPALDDLIARFPGLLQKVKRWLQNRRKVARRKKLEAELERQRAAGLDVSEALAELEVQDEQDEQDDEEDMELKEELHIVSAMVEAMVGYSIDDLGVIFSPYFITYIFIFRKETEINKQYGIRDQDFVFYIVFTVVIMFAQMIMDAFLDNIMELYHGFKTFEYVKFTRDRYSRRKTIWRGMDDQVNESLPAEIRSIDHMAFSSQFFFMSAMFAAGMLYTLFGVEIMFRKKYVMFSDPLFLFFVPVVLYCCALVKRLCLWLRRLLGIWNVPSDFSALDNLRTGQEGEAAEEAIFRRQLGAEFEATRWTVDAGFLASTNDDAENVGSLSARMSHPEVRDAFLTVNRPWLLHALIRYVEDEEEGATMPTRLLASAIVDSLKRETDADSVSHTTAFPEDPTAPQFHALQFPKVDTAYPSFMLDNNERTVERTNLPYGPTADRGHASPSSQSILVGDKIHRSPAGHNDSRNKTDRRVEVMDDVTTSDNESSTSNNSRRRAVRKELLPSSTSTTNVEMFSRFGFRAPATDEPITVGLRRDVRLLPEFTFDLAQRWILLTRSKQTR